MYYFYFDKLIYNQYDILKKINLDNLKFDRYGLKKSKSLYVHGCKIDDPIFKPITEQFVPGVIDQIMILKTIKFGEVGPHKDTRCTSLLLPLSGNFDNSFVEFYNNYVDVTQVNLVTNSDGAASQAAPNANSYKVGFPDFIINYNKPICINTKIIHSVKNPNLEDRFVISITIKKDVSFEEIYNDYNNCLILRT